MSDVECKAKKHYKTLYDRNKIIEKPIDIAKSLTVADVEVVEKLSYDELFEMESKCVDEMNFVESARKSSSIVLLGTMVMYIVTVQVLGEVVRDFLLYIAIALSLGVFVVLANHFICVLPTKKYVQEYKRYRTMGMYKYYEEETSQKIKSKDTKLSA